MKIFVSRRKILDAYGRWNQRQEFPSVELLLRPATGFAPGDMTSLDTRTMPSAFLKFLVEDELLDLTPPQRSKLYLAVHGTHADADMLCSKPADVHTFISSLRAQGTYNAEVKILGRWYPVLLKSTYHAPKDGWPAHTNVEGKLKLVDVQYPLHFMVTSQHFKDDVDETVPVPGKEVLAWFNLRHITQNVIEYDRRCGHAEEVRTRVGKLVGCRSSVLAAVPGQFGSMNIIEVPLGSVEVPKKVVIDDELEAQNARHTFDTREVVSVLPFVRAFSLDLKKWVYFDADDATEYEFDDRAIEWLVLPDAEKTLLSRLFTGARTGLFGDVLADKHGGMIILANGKPGVGKTLTAEVFAEVTHAPLYVMEMSELGIDTTKIEDNLGKVFRRVTRWGAILLLDEADVFLAHRGDSLERSVIVGIFLRLMDYYRGLLFLTSNRAQDIDEAFKSRITVRVDYPDLDRMARLAVWRVMLQHARLTVTGDVNGDLNGVPDLELNGRQIRNMTRLLKVLYGTNVTVEQVERTCAFACR